MTPTNLPVRICYSDSETGESYSSDVELKEFTAQAVADYFLAEEKDCSNSEGTELEPTFKVEAKAFVVQGDRACFIVEVTGSVYFSEYLIHGVIYTNFI